MKFSQAISKASVLGLVFCVAIGCAHKPKAVEYPDTTSAVEKSQDLQSSLDRAKAQQVDVLAQDDYKKAQKYFEDGKQKLNKEDPNQSKALKEFGMAEAYLMKANDKAEKVRPLVAAPLKARETALAGRAPEYAEKNMRKIDNEFADITEDLAEGDKVAAEELVKIEKRYFDVQAEGMTKGQLNEAYAFIQKAKDMRASRYAPVTLNEAENRVKSAENFIEANRADSAGVAKQSYEATAAARKAVEVTTLALGIKGVVMNREKVALEMWNKEQELNKTNANLATSQSRADALRSETAVLQSEAEALKERNANLRGEAAALGERNSELQTEAEWNQAINDAQKKFSKDEAEVYRQGNQLLIRLKKIQFPSSKSEVPSQAMPTLRKVSDVIAELSAEKVVVEGHTDSVGSAEVNKTLSQQRADSVKSFLASAGNVEAGEIETVGYGYEKPLTSNKTKEGRATNRRVDILIVP